MYDIQNDKLLNHLLENYGLTFAELMSHRDFYNKHHMNYGNEIYDDIKTRLVHLFEYLNGSWWNNRFNQYFKICKDYDTVVDFGFGLPYAAIKFPELIKNKCMIYIDSYKSAIEVSQHILAYLGHNNYKFINGSAEDTKLHRRIFENINEASTLVVALETVEHLSKPELFWKGLENASKAKISISLPVGPSIPSHESVFIEYAEAEAYMKSHLREFTLEEVPKKNEDAKFSLLLATGSVCFS